MTTSTVDVISIHKSQRQREKKNKGFRKSHRVFKNWHYNADGSRGAPKVLSHRFARYNADLTSTYYKNPSKGTKTVHGLAFDIDLSRTDIKWLDEKGRVSWSKIGSFLAKNEAQILAFITAAVSSTSGKGLGLYLPISPLEIVPSTASAQRSARILQAHLITIFNYYGIGADPGAMGLSRDMPNFFNPKKLIDSDMLGTSRLVDNKRYPVVAELLKYTNSHRAIRMLKKEDPKRLFSGHKTSEKKLASFYEYLLGEASQSSIWLSSAELIRLTGLSKETFYKFLSSKHEWLEIIYHGRSEGYELLFKPTKKHSERCYELLHCKDLDSLDKGLCLDFNQLDAPESVVDGSRNEYLTRAILELKHKGVEYHKAKDLMASLSSRIPGAKTSKNCRHISSLVRSIFYHRLDSFGSNFKPLSLILQKELKASMSTGLNLSPKKSKKGTTVGSIHFQNSQKVSEKKYQTDNLGEGILVKDGGH